MLEEAFDLDEANRRVKQQWIKQVQQVLEKEGFALEREIKFEEGLSRFEGTKDGETYSFLLAELPDQFWGSAMALSIMVASLVLKARKERIGYAVVVTNVRKLQKDLTQTFDQFGVGLLTVNRAGKYAWKLAARPVEKIDQVLEDMGHEIDRAQTPQELQTARQDLQQIVEELRKDLQQQIDGLWQIFQPFQTADPRETWAQVLLQQQINNLIGRVNELKKDQRNHFWGFIMLVVAIIGAIILL